MFENKLYVLEGYNSIGQLGLSSSENAAIFGVNFFQEGSTAAAPRETFKCLCTDCLDNSKLCVSDFRVSFSKINLQVYLLTPLSHECI